MRGRRRKRCGGPRGREKGRRGSWCRWIERGQCLLLFIIVCSLESQNAVLVSSWKFSLNCLLIFYFRERYMDRARRRAAGWEEEWSFYFFIFFCKLFFLFFFCFFFVFFCSVLPSSLLNARLLLCLRIFMSFIQKVVFISYYSTQGFKNSHLISPSTTAHFSECFFKK